MFEYGKLIETLPIDTLPRDTSASRPVIIALVGAGGKTSTMFALGKHFASEGLRVVLTTTTKVMLPSDSEVDFISIGEDLAGVEAGKTTFLGLRVSDTSKVTGFEPEDIQNWDQSTYDVLIYEADGAKRKAIKAPREGEPRLISSTNICIGVVGLDVIGKPANEKVVHRFEYFQKITGCTENSPLESRDIEHLVTHPLGLFKGVKPGCNKILLLTKMDTDERVNYADEIKAHLSQWQSPIVAI